MTGPATLAADADVASVARDRLDVAVEAMDRVEDSHRQVVAALIELWPTSAWLISGARTPKQWLVASTGASWSQADRLVRIAERCAAHPDLADAVVSGALPFRRAELLGRVVTDDRAPMLADSLAAILDLGCTTADDDDFATALRYWAERVDEHTAPRRPLPHSLHFSQRLFGGGRIEGDLAPGAYETIITAVDAFTQDPDPADSPYRRGLGERHADALWDMASFSLTYGADDLDLHHPADPDPAESDLDDWDDEEAWARDTYDGTCPTDELDEAIHNPGEVDPLRAKIRRSLDHQRRRARRKTRPRSGVTVNVHIDLRTLLGDRDIDDFEGLVLRGEGWKLARTALDQHLCDSALVATLFAGRKQVLDANTAAEQFNRRQRRAITAAHPTCIGPGCTTPAHRCHMHHVQHREHDGPTTTANGVPACPFHHRLIHQHGWTLHREPDGSWTMVDPHGHRHPTRKPGDQSAR